MADEPVSGDEIKLLELKTGEVITEDWYDHLADVLRRMNVSGVLSPYGYVLDDLKPIRDLAINLGYENLRFDEVHAGYGHFSYNVTVAGKNVIKDGDPINVAEFFDEAQKQMRQAAYYGVLDALIAREPQLLASVVNVTASDYTDILSEDVESTRSGKLRIQMLLSGDAYGYAKITPSGETQALVALLNEGAMIKGGIWHEEELSTEKGDKTNVRVSPSRDVTLRIWNV